MRITGSKTKTFTVTLIIFGWLVSAALVINKVGPKYGREYPGITMNQAMIYMVSVLKSEEFLNIKAEQRDGRAIITGYNDYGPDSMLIIIINNTEDGVIVKISASPREHKPKRIFKLFEEKINEQKG